MKSHSAIKKANPVGNTVYINYKLLHLLSVILELKKYHKYWSKRSLDYLWYGIGLYLKSHPEIRYLFGGVSLSTNYPKAARDWHVI